MSSTTLSPFSGSPAPTKNELVADSKVGVVASAAPAKPKTKNRKRVNSAEKRSQHNAIERQRRETLNGKFVSLARLLPALANVRRPSKSAIVNGSIAHLNYQRNQRLLAAKLLRQVCVQHDQLLEELNHWRSRSGVAPKDVSPVWTSEMDDICAVEKEVFGVFSNEDGMDDNDDDGVNDASFDAGMTASLSSLITSRSSTDMDAMSSSLFLAQATAQQPTANALNWSRDFAFGSMSSSTSSLPFNAFMSDNLDQSSTGSPANSIQGNVLTPPTTAELAMYTHTPSPRSSLGEDMVNAHPVTAASMGAPNNWSEQQMMFLQSMQAHPPVRQQSMPALSGLHGNPFNQQGNPANNNSTNMFNNLFAQHAQTHVPQAQTLLSAAAANGSDAFTQSLLAQMFPSQGVPEDSVAQWRKLAMAGLTNPEALAATVRPSVLRSNSMWEQSHAVEGF